MAKLTELRSRICTVLERAGINNFTDLRRLVETEGYAAVADIYGIGPKSLEEIEDALKHAEAGCVQCRHEYTPYTATCLTGHNGFKEGQTIEVCLYCAQGLTQVKANAELWSVEPRPRLHMCRVCKARPVDQLKKTGQNAGLHLARQCKLCSEQQSAADKAAQTAGRESGKVKWFSKEKGYGFISCGRDVDVFVHYSDIQGNGFCVLEKGQQVEFSVEKTEKGLKAVEVSQITADGEESDSAVKGDKKYVVDAELKGLCAEIDRMVDSGSSLSPEDKRDLARTLRHARSGHVAAAKSLAQSVLEGLQGSLEHSAEVELTSEEQAMDATDQLPFGPSDQEAEVANRLEEMEASLREVTDLCEKANFLSGVTDALEYWQLAVLAADEEGDEEVALQFLDECEKELETARGLVQAELDARKEHKVPEGDGNGCLSQLRRQQEDALVELEPSRYEDETRVAVSA